jgi:hypothetical protein
MPLLQFAGSPLKCTGNRPQTALLLGGRRRASCLIRPSWHSGKKESCRTKTFETGLEQRLKTETMAALLWPLDSPAFSAGRYALVDIGAGTTNVSIFRIVKTRMGDRWVNERVDCHSSVSDPIGMDAIDRQLADASGLDVNRCFSIRGREQALLNDQRYLGCCKQTLDGIQRNPFSLLSSLDVRCAYAQGENRDLTMVKP